jgi:hypothetical protein
MDGKINLRTDHCGISGPRMNTTICPVILEDRVQTKQYTTSLLK